MPLKENLKQLRIAHKVKQKDLAQYLGISSIAVANYENGRSQPDLDTAKKIADFFSYYHRWTDCWIIPFEKAWRK